MAWQLICTCLMNLIFLEITGQSNYIDSNIPESSKSNITSKINKIASDILSHSSPNNREFVIKSVEKKLFKTVEHLGEKGKKHVQVIMEGIKEKILNFTQQSSKSSSNKKLSHLKNNELAAIGTNGSIESKQMDETLSDKIENLIKTEVSKLKSEQSKRDLLENIKRGLLKGVDDNLRLFPKIISNETRRVIAIKDKVKFYNYYHNNHKETTTSAGYDTFVTAYALKTFTIADVCKDVHNKVCSDIKEMNNLKCIYDDIFISLDKLCDGSIDCSHKSDEKYCASQVMERLEFSNRVIQKIYSLSVHKCFNTEELRSTNRANVLRDILQSQIDFKDKYYNFSTHLSKLSEKNKDDSVTIINRKANEIAIVISSLALSLEGALCLERSENIAAQRRTNVFDIDKMLQEITWPPKCDCEKENCTDCQENTCQRICWQKLSLSYWSCESQNGSRYVSLNSLCDDKLDCLDESDESFCDAATGYEKYESYGVFNDILEMIHFKANKERSSTRKQLLFLRNLIVELQKLTTKMIPNKQAIRRLRNKCFDILKSIYIDILNQCLGPGELEEAFIFLAAVNKNLGLALKRSHTGNNKLIADNCYCRNGSCAMHLCAKNCIKACGAEEKLLRYKCKVSNTYVSFDKVCDGRKDCEDESDERSCRKDEICRRHHLLVLKSTLQEAGARLEGTSLGELIIKWKTKVISTINVAEKDNRPNPRVFRNIIMDVLKDLVLAYGSVEEYRRSNKQYALEEFINIAQAIMETVKYCRK